MINQMKEIVCPACGRSLTGYNFNNDLYVGMTFDERKRHYNECNGAGFPCGDPNHGEYGAACPCTENQ